MAASYPNGSKTLWEKEKLLVTSNFSFSHSVFKRLVMQICENQGLFGKGLNTCSIQLHRFHFVVYNKWKGFTGQISVIEQRRVQSKTGCNVQAVTAVHSLQNKSMVTNTRIRFLTIHYHNMPHFGALKIYSCGKHCEKRRNCL